MANIVLAHGAWSAAWAWKKMRPLLRAAGHDFFSPTYTGLGARAHLVASVVGRVARLTRHRPTRALVRALHGAQFLLQVLDLVA